MSLESSWWSSFSVTFSAIDWPGAVWLERNFTFLSAVSAGSLVHLFSIHYSVSTPVYWLAQKLVLHALSMLLLRFKVIV